MGEGQRLVAHASGLERYDWQILSPFVGSDASLPLDDVFTVASGVNLAKYSAI
jgi:hypothetical protein